MSKQPVKPKARLVLAAFVSAMQRAGYSPAIIEETLSAGPLDPSTLIGTGVKVELVLPPQHTEDTADGYFVPQGYKPASQAAFDRFIREGGTVTKLGYADKVFLEAQAEAKKRAARETKRAAKAITAADLELEL